jgi:transcriptional regulator with XRE-family HTH domain
MVRVEIEDVYPIIAQLRATAEKRGLSQAAVARLSGVSQQAVNRIFTGRSASPQLSCVLQIAAGLGVRVGVVG